jgi:hypothetical protein
MIMCSQYSLTMVVILNYKKQAMTTKSTITSPTTAVINCSCQGGNREGGQLASSSHVASLVNLTGSAFDTD